MGIRIIDTIYQTEGISLAGATEMPGHARLGSDVGELLGREKTSIPIVDSLEKVSDDYDVVIDFTAPDSSLKSLDLVHAKGKATVIGTTGFTTEQTARITTLTQDIPCVFAPNMSVGINLMFSLISQVAEKLQDDYDIEIIEAHHRLKKDSPSGTAEKMAHILAEAVNRDLDTVAVHQRKGIIGPRKKDTVAVHQRKGIIGPRKKEEIGIQVIRAGDIVGEHTVLFGGLGERLEITHKAHNRDTFARGAVRAAQWIVSRPPGLYDMLDVLGLK
jgi:4-hydroxy-tetrahydrodipicolinate reductase